MQTSAVLLLLTLPALVRSTAYHLNIYIPDLATSDTFNASVKINVTVSASTDSFTLHSDGLEIEQSSVSVLHKSRVRGWRPENIANVVQNNSLLVINLERPAAIGDYSLSLQYTGRFQNRMAGFCKVGYHFNRMQKYMAITNFDPTNARMVFPCYDDLDHRTNFTLDITVNKSLIVLSSVNPTYVQNVTETTKVFRFDGYPESPIHSLGWAVLDHTTFQLQSNVAGTMTVHTRAPYPYSNHTAWASQVTANLLVALYNYTGQDCSLTKLEQIVVPEFFTGSSEGWGIISYSEEALLVTPGRSSAQYTQEAALGLARGLAHQWYGDLVSMDTWHNTWLTTGLTEHLKYIVTHSLNDMRDWELAEQEVVDLVQSALALDVSGHALVDNTHSEAEEVREACDDITKYKGGAIILMLHNIFKDDAFKSGLAAYLSDARGQSSTPEDLWNILYEVAQESDLDLDLQSVNTIMDEWTVAPGYPTLYVTWNTTHFIISQPTSGRWYIPVMYMLENSAGVVTSRWIQPGASLVVPASDPQWILLNVNQTGFYRVNYEVALWQRLMQQLNSDLTRIPRLSRAQLVDDVFALVQRGTLSYEFLIQFTNYLQAETDYYPWRTALRHFQALLDKFYGHSSYVLLKQHLLDLVTKVVDDVGYTRKPQDSHVAKLKQAFILEKACGFNHSVCVQKSVNMLRSWMASTYFDADLSTSLLCSGIANSPIGVWRAVRDMVKYSVFPSVRASLLKALTCTHDQPVLMEFLRNITSKRVSLMSLKDRNIFLQTLASTPSGAEVLLDWVLQQLYTQIDPIVPEASASPTPELQTSVTVSEYEPTSTSTEQPESNSPHSLTVRSTEPLTESDVLIILSYILPKLSTTEQADKLDKFAALNSTGVSDSTLAVIKKSALTVHQQADWAIKQNVNMTIWLKNMAAPETTTNAPADVSTASLPAAPSCGEITSLSSLALASLVLVSSYLFCLNY